jgi:cytochrome c peroxidase
MPAVIRWSLLAPFLLAAVVSAQDRGILDLNDLANYANQPVPTYITKDNTPADNPLTNSGATLRRVLFYDKNLSVDGTVACASCHLQQSAFSDPAQVSMGVHGATGRHSMRLINTRFAAERRFFWDERAASLEAQATMPIQDHAEMGFSGEQGDPPLDSLLTRMAGGEYYRRLFDFTYGDPVITEQRMHLAIAQFLRSIQSFDSRFDEGLAQTGDVAVPFPNFSERENTGKQLFLGRPVYAPGGLRISGGFGCAGCHTPPEFDIRPDSGNNGFTVRLGGGRDFDNARVPTLRDVVDADGNVHGGLMHAGSFSTLRAAINHYELIRIVSGNTRLDSVLVIDGRGAHLEMEGRQRQDVATFLGTLTGSNVYADKKWSDPFDTEGNLAVIGGAPSIPTSVATVGGATTQTFVLAPNYPNPFNPTTTITYQVAQASVVSLRIYSVLGQRLAVPVQGFHRPGVYRFLFEAGELPSGIYLYRLIVDGQAVETRKMLLSK